jgi:hypothetical protein
LCDIDRFNSFDGSLARVKLGFPPGIPVIGTVEGSILKKGKNTSLKLSLY